MLQDTLDYSDNTMNDALVFEKTFFEFFLNVKDILRSSNFVINETASLTKWSQDDLLLNSKLLNCQQLVDDALCDNIDTRSALDAMRDLVTAVNVYLKGCAANCLLIRTIANYVAKILIVFGVLDEKSPEIKFDPVVNNGLDSAVDKEELLMPYLEQLAKFREKMRSVGIQLKHKEIMQACDELRDEILPNLGVRLEDKDNRTVLKLVGREQLLKEREAKLQAEREKQLEKERKKQEQLAKEAKNKINPKEMFLSETDKYSKFDENVSCNCNYFVMQ